MFKKIQALTANEEFAIVVGVAYATIQIAHALASSALASPTTITESYLVSLVICELIALLAISAFLHVRGWSLERIGLAPNLPQTIIGVCLAAITYAASAIIWLLLAAMSSQLRQAGESFNVVPSGVDPVLTIAVSIVNPICEEALLCGYMITALRQRGLAPLGVGLSVGVRTFFHLYQGVVGMIFIIPFGMIFAWFYLTRGRLWPLIVAHVLFDFIPLLWPGK